MGRIQGRQFAALAQQGNVLYIEGPSCVGGRFRSSHQRHAFRQAARPGIEGNQRRLDGAQRTSCHQVVAIVEHVPKTRYSRGRVPNDAMAKGARNAFAELPETEERERYLKVPFTGCDGVTKTGQEWVRRGLLTATVVSPPTAGLALEILARAVQTRYRPAERTPIAPWSFPKVKS